MGGREQDGNVPRGRVALQPSRDLEPVHRLAVQAAVRERHVHDDQVHTRRFDLLDDARRILGDLDHVVALPRQDELEELGVHGIVFDDHDSLRHSSLAEPDSALGGAAGNVRVTRVPLPAPSLSIAIVPPIRWTRDFVITRPSPAPWWRRR